MAASLSTLTVAERLTQALATIRTCSGDESSALSVTIAIDPIEWPSPDPASRNAVRWEQPSSGFAAAAFGTAHEIRATGPARFEEVRAAWGRYASDVHQAGDPDGHRLPLAFAAFTFAASGGAATGPSAILRVPRLLLLREGGRHWLRANLTVAADFRPENVAAEIEHEFTTVIGEEPSSAHRRGWKASATPDADRSDGAGSAAPAFRPRTPQAPATTPERLDFREDTAPEAWAAAVRGALSQIEIGEVEKVVLARRLVAEVSLRPELAPVLERLRGRFPECTVFAFEQDAGVFFGATPERLVRVEDGKVSIDCLAGSIRRGRTADEDAALGGTLMADAKERHEHAVVLRVLLEQIGEICEQIEAAEAPVLRKFQNIQHLYTPVRAVAHPGHDLLDFVERLHPTPATGGRPREKALALIQQHESFDRSWYAGPVGWLNADGGGEFVVGIRSAIATDTEVTVAAGCGIVEGSDPERELAESRLKMKAMLWALNSD